MIMCIGFGRQRDEVPEIVVGAGGLRKVLVGLLLDRVDDVGKLDRVLDEEHRDVVADEVPVALLGIELHRKAAHVARHVERALVAGDGRKAHEHRGAFARALQDVGLGQLGLRLVVLEKAVRAVAAGMHHALGNALVVEVEDLLAEMAVLEQCRATGPLLERILVVGDGMALRVGEDGVSLLRLLVGLAACALGDRLFAVHRLVRRRLLGGPCHDCSSGHPVRPVAQARPG